MTTALTNFTYIIINPNNNYENNKSDYFNDDIYKCINHNTNDLPIDNDVGQLKLVEVLSNYKYIKEDVANNKTIHQIFEKYVNPNDNDGHDYDTKIILENDNYVYQILFDYSFKSQSNLFNHMATYLTVENFPIHGPVFLCKISKLYSTNAINKTKKIYKHENTTINDLADLLLSTKQVFCWNYTNKQWNLELIYNNNKTLSITHKLFNLNHSILFYKIKQNITLTENEAQKILMNHIKNIHELGNYFDDIKICKIRFNDLEYCETTEIANDTYKAIIEGVVNSFTEYDKNRIIMNSIFQNVSKKLIL